MALAGIYQEIRLAVEINFIDSGLGRFNFTVHFETLLRPLDHPLNICSLLLRCHILR